MGKQTKRCENADFNAQQKRNRGGRNNQKDWIPKTIIFEAWEFQGT